MFVNLAFPSGLERRDYKPSSSTPVKNDESGRGSRGGNDSRNFSVYIDISAWRSRNLDIGLHISAVYPLNNLLRWVSQNLRDDRELVNMVFTWKEGRSPEHLGKNASCAPHVNGVAIFLPCQHDFWGPVISCHDIAGHLVVLLPRESKITNFKITIVVNEEILGLQVTMDNTG